MVSGETEAKEKEEAASEETRNQGKCTKRFALIAEKNAKFLSSHQKTDLFTARTATESIKDSKTDLILDKLKNFYSFL